MVGKVFIQIRDTKQSGAILDSVSIDYLAIWTTPFKPLAEGTPGAAAHGAVEA